MRMKDVCGRTGLTDRAVRLYMDSGLITPDAESSYTGRKSIRFSESDVEILEAVATLRKADFSIADIRAMQSEPEKVEEILEAHKQKLVGDIENKQMILARLREIDGTAAPTYMEIAGHLRRSASLNHIPKEDLSMRWRDVQEIVKKRIPALVAFAVMLVGIVLLTPVTVRTMFGETRIHAGGGYEWVYTFSADAFITCLPLVIAWLCMAAVIAVLFDYLIGGKNRHLLVSGILCILAATAMLLLGEEADAEMYSCEFLQYRFSFMWSIMKGETEGFDFFIRSLKYIPITAAAVLSFVSFFRQRTQQTEEENLIQKIAPVRRAKKEKSRESKKITPNTEPLHKSPVIAFVFLLADVILFTPVVIRTIFGEIRILSGGGYEYVYDLSIYTFVAYLSLVIAWACMTAAVVVLFLQMIRRQKILLLVSGVLCVVTTAILLFQPWMIREQLYLSEFVMYRHSFMWSVLSGSSEWFDLYIRSLKFIPLITAGILVFVSFFRRKHNTEENIAHSDSH